MNSHKYFPFFILLFGVLLSFLLAACQAVPPPEISFPPASLRLSGERVFDLESDFVTRFPNRHSGQPNNRLAAEWLLQQYSNLGWNCRLDEWQIVNYSRPVTLNNVVCSLPGDSQREMLVVAHHDQASTTLQGADNDGSGVAILLHLAEIFAAESPLPYTLVFVSTDAEEYGMIGSGRYIQTHPDPRNIIAGLSLDNLGRTYYDAMNMEQIGQYRRFGPLWLALAAREASRSANLWEVHLTSLVDQITGQAAPVSFMDQGPIVAAGVPALGFAGHVPAQNADEHFRLWHDPDDTLDRQSAATLGQSGRTVEALLRQLLSMKSFPEESGPYLYFDGSRQVLRGLPLWLIFIAFVAIFFLGGVMRRSYWALALPVTGGFLAILMFTSLPRIPLFVLGGACLGIASMLNRREAKTSEDDQLKAEEEKNAKPKEERVEDFLTIDPMEMELGVGLIRLADPNRGGDLLDRVQRVRQNVAGDVGILLPKVRIRDNMRLDAQQYRIKIADMPIAQGEVEPGRMLAIDSGMTTGQIDGIQTKDPAFGTDAKWIDPALATQAEMFGYTVVEPGAVLATHLTEVCRRHADEILTRDATKHLVDELKKTSPAVVDGLIPSVMSVAEVQGILQLLLREQVSVRQLGLILETLGDHAVRSKDPILLTEYVRHRLARQICTRYRNAEGELFVVALDPALEDRIRAGYEHTERGMFIRLSPQAVESTCQAMASEIEKLTTANHTPMVLVSPQIRAAVKRITENHLPQLVVLSFNEITRDTKIVTLGIVSDAG